MDDESDAEHVIEIDETFLDGLGTQISEGDPVQACTSCGTVCVIQNTNRCPICHFSICLNCVARYIDNGAGREPETEGAQSHSECRSGICKSCWRSVHTRQVLLLVFWVLTTPFRFFLRPLKAQLWGANYRFDGLESAQPVSDETALRPASGRTTVTRNIPVIFLIGF